VRCAFYISFFIEKVVNNLPRGQKTPPEVVHQIMASWVVTNNFLQTSRDLGLPFSTVKKIVYDNKDKPEFIKLREKQMEEFSSKASEIIQKGLMLLNRRFDRAITSEEELDDLIEEVYFKDKDEMTYPEKQSLIAKIKSLQLQDIKAITTAIGTLYDKKALADGKPTEKVEIIGDDKLEILAELAGYAKR